MPRSLEVFPPQLAALARSLAQMVEQTNSAVPDEKVQAAGGDDISRAAAARLAKQGAQLANLIIEGLIILHRASHAIGASAEGYSRVDPDAAEAIARALGGSSGTPRSGIVPNPVSADVQIPRRDVPTASTVIPSVCWEPETFAQQFEQGGGDGGASLQSFRGTWADVYGYYVHEMLGGTINETTTGAREWRPHGTQVATLFEQFKRWHDQVGAHVSTLVQRAADYRTAYDNVKSAHPTLATIRAAKEKVRTASTPEARTAAMWELYELGTQAQRAQEQYRNAVDSGVPDRDANSEVDRPPAIAAGINRAVNSSAPTPRATPDRRGTRSTQSGANNGLNNLLSSLGQNLLNQPAAAATTAPTTAQTPTAAANQANAGQTPQMPDLSQLAKDPNAGTTDDSLDPLLDDSLLENPLDYASGPGGYGGPGGGVASGVPTSALGVPLVGTGSLGAPKTADATRFGVPAASGRAQTGPGGMPYMPYMPGMGGANGNERDRKNPFATEAKIVDDDELRSQVLASATVNEKPPMLPPEATHPTETRIATKKQETAPV